MYVRFIEKGDQTDFLSLNEEFYSCGATQRGYDESISLKTFNQVVSRHENLWGYMLVDSDTSLSLGYALVTSYWCNEDGGNVIILDELYISQKGRNKGYAKKFMEWLENEFKDEAVSITLEVVTTNTAAKQLYAKEGYSEDGFMVLTKRL